MEGRKLFGLKDVALAAVFTVGMGVGCSAEAKNYEMPTLIPTVTDTVTPTATLTPTETLTPTPTVTNTPEPTSTPEPTRIPVETAVSRKETSLSQEELLIINEINLERNRYGLSSLSVDPKFMDFARQKSREMANAHQIYHGGNVTAQVINICNNQANFAEVAENIGVVNSTFKIDYIVGAWMDSSGHFANIIDGSLRTVGVGIAHGNDGKNYFTYLAAAAHCRV